MHSFSSESTAVAYEISLDLGMGGQIFVTYFRGMSYFYSGVMGRGLKCAKFRVTYFMDGPLPRLINNNAKFMRP